MPECPVDLTHTDGPAGYLAWHEWAAEMSKTHRQRKCPTCGLYKIWIENPSRPVKPQPDGASQPAAGYAPSTAADTQWAE